MDTGHIRKQMDLQNPPPQFTVRYSLDTNILLQLYDVLYSLVFYAPQLLCGALLLLEQRAFGV